MRRHGKDPDAIVDKLMSKWNGKVSAERFAELKRRSGELMTQGHLSQHVFFHYFHHPALALNSRWIFGVRSADYHRARLRGWSPARDRSTHRPLARAGRSPCDGRAEALRPPGRPSHRAELARRRRSCSLQRSSAAPPTAGSTRTSTSTARAIFRTAVPPLKGSQSAARLHLPRRPKPRQGRARAPLSAGRPARENVRRDARRGGLDQAGEAFDARADLLRGGAAVAEAHAAAAALRAMKSLPGVIGTPASAARAASSSVSTLSGKIDPEEVAAGRHDEACVGQELS